MKIDVSFLPIYAAAFLLTFARIGTLSSPSPGSSITIVPMRANTRRKVAASTGRKEMSIFI